MEFTYDVNGKVIKAYVWEDMENGQLYHKKIDVTPYYDGMPGRKAKKCLELDYSNNEVFFRWNGERVYIKDFVYKPVDTLIDMINKREFVTCEDFVACMRKDSAFGLVKEVESTSYMQNLAPNIPSVQKLLFRPVEDGHYSKRNWNYKVAIEAEDPYTHMKIHDTFYTWDLISLIMSGIIKLVNLSKYDPTVEEKVSEMEKPKGFFTKIFSKFKK